MIPAVPLLIRAFADRLREDQGRQLGRAVLFASIVGFDVVERRKGDIAAISGVSAARIQEIVDTGRQALNTASPRVREQHVVSRALLRRFLGPTNQGDRLLSYNLQFGKAYLRAPGAVGKLENFVKIDSRETEQLWGLTEQDLPAAIKAARTRRVLQNPKHVAVIKDAIALHFARSLDTLESVEQNWQQTLATARAAYIADRPAMEQLFYQKHGYYASGSTVAEEIADDLLSDGYGSEPERCLLPAACCRPLRGGAQDSGGIPPGDHLVPSAPVPRSCSVTCPRSPSALEVLPSASLAVCHSATRPQSSFPSVHGGLPRSIERTTSRL